ncbi:MAG: hypothetical protein ACREK2_10600, partial [Gemmatimonadota bacterium]
IMKSFTGDYLSSGTGLEPEEISDAIDELEDRGLVQKVVTMGNAPYRFMWVEPTYLLWMEYSAYVVYDPKEDVFAVARAIAALNEAEGDDIQARTSLSVGRINRAVDYIREYGLADVDRWMGTAPYTFGRARATFRTRQA